MSQITKSVLFFSVIIFTLLSQTSNSFAYTDAELSQMYKGTDGNSTLVNIQNAINDHSLKCSDLPADIIAFNCADTQAKLDAAKGITPQSTKSSDNPLVNFSSIIVILIIPIPILIILLRILSRPNESDIDSSPDKITNDSTDKVPKVSMDIFKTRDRHPMGDKTHD